LPVVIVAAVVILCTASTVSAWVTLYVTPDRHVTCPQTSNYWAPTSSPQEYLDDKTVKYTITVETDNPPVYVVIIPEETPIGWFIPPLSHTLPSPNTAGIWLQGLRVPLTLGEDAGGVYAFTITAVDAGGASAHATVYLEVQDHDYVSETYIATNTNNTAKVTLDGRFRSMAIATSMDKDIEFDGTVEVFEENEYLIFNARGDNANFQQESIIVEFNGPYLRGTETLKSCAALGGTGVTLSESYDVHWMDQRVKSLGQYITGEQRYKTELSTYNEFNGTFRLDARQTVPISRSVREHQTVEGNLTYARHIIYRLP